MRAAVRTRLTIAVAVAIMLLVSLLVMTPARLASWFLPAGQVHVQAWRGTLWDGGASAVSIAVPGGWFHLGDVRWRLSPLSLLLLSPRAELESQWGSQRIEADIARSIGGSLRLRDTSASFPAALVKRWIPVELGGNMNLLLQDLRLEGQQPVGGEGRLVWQKAFWVGNNSSQALGDYALAFEVQGEQAVSGEVITLAGPVEIEGTLSLAGRRYSVDARLRSQQGFGEEIANALQLMASPVDGGFHVQFSSEF